MEFFDEITIKASQKAVYSALNDPAVLRQCIPGCDELIQHSPTNLRKSKTILKNQENTTTTIKQSVRFHINHDF